MSNIYNDSAHRLLAAKLATSKTERAYLYWEIGVQLNLDYGHNPSLDTMPGNERLKLAELYGLSDYSSSVTFSAARRFAADPDSDTAGKARQVIREYQTWSNITKDFLAGREPGTYQRTLAERRQRDRQDAEQFRAQEIPAAETAPPTAGDNRSFNVHPSVVDLVALALQYPRHEVLGLMKKVQNDDPEWLASVFTARLRRSLSVL